MKTKLISIFLCVCMLISAMPAVSIFAAEGDALTVTSPDGKIVFSFYLSDAGEAMYTVANDGYTIIEPSKMGLYTSIADFADGFSIKKSLTASSDTTWKPVVGEQETIRDNYNELTVTLSHDSGYDFIIKIRAYNEGAAFRYILPEASGDESYTVTQEYTTFAFPAGATAATHSGGNQTIPTKIAVENFSTSAKYMRPMEILYANGYAMTLCEADLHNYSVLALRGSGAGTRTLNSFYPDGLKARNGADANPYVTVTSEGPASTPWRVFVIGKAEAELPKNATIVENLSTPADEETYKFSEWVDPGSCLRAASGMNTDAIKGIVDQAEANGIKYVLLDTGWYGPEYDVNCDPRLDPTVLDPENEWDAILLEKYFGQDGEGKYGTGEGIFNTRGNGFPTYGTLAESGTSQTNVDIPTLCDYANERGVGIILYVNGVYFPDSSGRDRFDADELFAYFEKWGVKGVKPGFVACRAQDFEKNMEIVIEAAAKHKLILTIHDEYVPAGLQRTYPNMFCTEGILGDEGIGKGSDPQVEYDIATLLTRPIQSPTDHTYCYPGKATKAYALASPIMFRTGMNVLYWYTNPNSITAADRDRINIWDNMPGTWKTSLFLEAKSYSHATYARESFDGSWYIGSLSAVERQLSIPLTFLDGTKTYKATIYRDSPLADAKAGWNNSAKAAQELIVDSYIVDSSATLENTMYYGTGYAVYLTEATAEDISSLPAYDYEKIALSNEIVIGDAINGAIYTEETRSVFEAALTAAKSVLADTAATSEDYAQAQESLKSAREALAYSFANLNALIATAENLPEYIYSADSYEALAEALAPAKALAEAGDSSDTDAIIAAEEALEEAIKSLVFVGGTVKSSTYLSDMAYTSANYTGTASINFKKDTNRSGAAISLIVDGTVTEFSKGIAADAPSTITYAVPEGADTLEAYVGVDYTKVGAGNIIFRVYDESGNVLAETGELTGSSDAVKLIVPVRGTASVTLENDMNGNQGSDWSTWADAKFVTYADPSKALSAIKINGVALDGFTPEVYSYSVDAEDYSEVPEIEAVLEDTNATATVITPKALPGIAVVGITTSNGKQLTYRISLNSYSLSSYLSDISYSEVTTYGTNIGVDKDRRGNPITVWNEDGTTTTYQKGIGAEASTSTTSSVTYDISSYDFGAFEALASISYYALAAEQVKIDAGEITTPRSSIIFKFYLDEELVYETPVMRCEDPAHKVKFDIGGASTLRIEFNANADQSADWGILADAKFLDVTNGEDEDLNLTYTQNDDFTLTITGFKQTPATGSKMTLTIPETIGGLPVTIIGENAFNETQTDGGKANIIQSVSLPDTIKRIENKAFFDCWALKTINLPEGLEHIGAQAFVHASGGLNLTLPSTIKSIGAQAFQYCSGAKITLNDGLESIGARAFHWNNTAEVIIPDSVTTIGSQAFRTCLLIKTFRFPRNDTYNTIAWDTITVDNTSTQSVNIEHLYIPETITTVPDTMFSHFKSGGTCYVYAAKNSAAEAAVVSAMDNDKTNGCTLVLVEYDYENEDLYTPVTVNVSGGEATLSENGETTKNIGSTHTSDYISGTALTLTAVPESEASTFMYWVDASSNRIVSTSECYSFTVGSALSLRAVFAKEADGYFITFININDAVLASGLASGGVTVPANPYISGYVFDGWYESGVKQSFTVGETLSSADANTTYRAGFKRDNKMYTVTTVNANEEGASYLYNAKVTVTPIDKSSESLIFAYWEKNGEKVSYSEEYTFYVSGDAEVRAVYSSDAAAADNLISITATQVDSSRIGFFIEYDIKTEYTVIEAGVLIGESAGLEVGTAPIKAVALSKNNRGQYTVRKANLTTGDICCGRGYVIYSDGSEIYTIYSDEVSKTVE